MKRFLFILLFLSACTDNSLRTDKVYTQYLSPEIITADGIRVNLDLVMQVQYLTNMKMDAEAQSLYTLEYNLLIQDHCEKLYSAYKVRDFVHNPGDIRNKLNIDQINPLLKEHNVVLRNLEAQDLRFPEEIESIIQTNLALADAREQLRYEDVKRDALPDEDDRDEYDYNHNSDIRYAIIQMEYYLKKHDKYNISK